MVADEVDEPLGRVGEEPVGGLFDDASDGALGVVGFTVCHAVFGEVSGPLLDRRRGDSVELVEMPAGRVWQGAWCRVEIEDLDVSPGE